MKLEKYSIGTGDRYDLEHEAQLKAVMAAGKEGAEIAAVWNKSNREHVLIGSKPEDVRLASESAVRNLGWEGAWHLDADHINLETVDTFMDACDFFTLDVADFTGKPASRSDIETFVQSCSRFTGKLEIPGIETPLNITEEKIRAIGAKYLLAVKEAGKIYRKIENNKGKDNFITEVSMDETDDPQTPEELFFILKAVSDEGIPAQTIAPKFTGRFNKGVEYSGDLSKFDREFYEDLSVIRRAIELFDLPVNLKLSIHSGSDKFALYPIMKKHIRALDSGLHLKTCGTTWLEEVIGLAESGNEGLDLAKDFYRGSFERYDEMAGPYLEVIDIDRSKLPSPDEVDKWTPDEYTAALRHDQSNPAYNIHLRQLVHIGFRIAAEMGERYLTALKENRGVIEKNVFENLFERHIRPLFMD